MVHVYGESGSGAPMVPEGKGHIKDEACLVCKRNGERRKIYGSGYGHKVMILATARMSLSLLENQRTYPVDFVGFLATRRYRLAEGAWKPASLTWVIH